jgi:hypothetical protein
MARLDFEAFQDGVEGGANGAEGSLKDFVERRRAFLLK